MTTAIPPLPAPLEGMTAHSSRPGLSVESLPVAGNLAPEAVHRTPLPELGNFARFVAEDMPVTPKTPPMPSPPADYTDEDLREAGVDVYVVGQSPLFGNQVQTLFAQAGGTSEQPTASGQVTFAPDLNARLSASMPPGVTFIDPLASMCELPACQYRRDGEFLLWDEGHLSAYGSSLGVDTYFPYLD